MVVLGCVDADLEAIRGLPRSFRRILRNHVRMFRGKEVGKSHLLRRHVEEAVPVRLEDLDPLRGRRRAARKPDANHLPRFGLAELELCMLSGHQYTQYQT